MIDPKADLKGPTTATAGNYRAAGHPAGGEASMTLSVAIGGAKGTFEDRIGFEVVGVLDRAFGAEGDWEGVAAQRFGELTPEALVDLRLRAAAELGGDFVPHLSTAIGDGQTGTGVFLPAHIRAVTLPLPSCGPLRCASLPGLRVELAALADRWNLPLDDPGLFELLRVYDDPADGPIAEHIEDITFARLALAANEAERRDCPLWLLG